MIYIPILYTEEGFDDPWTHHLGVDPVKECIVWQPGNIFLKSILSPDALDSKVKEIVEEFDNGIF